MLTIDNLYKRAAMSRREWKKLEYIKDIDCTKDTPVILGIKDKPVYGTGYKVQPKVKGRVDSEHFKKIFLPELLPLEEYDLIVVLLSGGKDTIIQVGNFSYSGSWRLISGNP